MAISSRYGNAMTIFLRNSGVIHLTTELRSRTKVRVVQDGPLLRLTTHNLGFCMDLDNGILTTNYKVQTWTCSDNNENQVWKL